MTARIAMTIALSLIVVGVAHVGAEAQQPSGYWLYVDGEWKGGFVRREDCDAAATRMSGKAYECRPVLVNPGTGSAGAGTPRDQMQRLDSAWANAVQYCIGEGQRRDKAFDAYVSGPGGVRMVGTPVARTAFTKCMTEEGQPLSPAPSPIEIK